MALRAGQKGIGPGHRLISEPRASIGGDGLNWRLWKVLVETHPAVRPRTVVVDRAR
jgi:hypothetical protein